MLTTQRSTGGRFMSTPRALTTTTGPLGASAPAGSTSLTYSILTQGIRNPTVGLASKGSASWETLLQGIK